MPPVTRRGRRVAGNAANFDVPTLESLAIALKTGRTALDRLTVTDPDTPGLRAIIRNTGLISFHVNYRIGDSRPYLKLGDHPEMTIADARQLAKTVHGLADKGIDPQAGLHERLIRELKAKGTKWRP